MVIMVSLAMIVYLCYLGIGFVAGRVFMAIEFALMKPKYENYKILNVGEKFTQAHDTNTKRSWDIIHSSHTVPLHFKEVHVLDPNYYRELEPKEMAASYYLKNPKENIRKFN